MLEDRSKTPRKVDYIAYYTCRSCGCRRAKRVSIERLTTMENLAQLPLMELHHGCGGSNFLGITELTYTQEDTWSNYEED